MVYCRFLEMEYATFNKLHHGEVGNWRWEGRKIFHALTNEALYAVTTEELPLAQSLQYGRDVGEGACESDIPTAWRDAESRCQILTCS